MRTTIDLDHDVSAAAKEIAHMENASPGKVVSRLLREALTDGSVESSVSQTASGATGFVPFKPRAVVVSNELIDGLRDAERV